MCIRDSAMTPNSLAVLRSCILDENYVTVMHVPLSTPVENTLLKTWLTYMQNCYVVFVCSQSKKRTSAESRRYSYYLGSESFIGVVA